jgi:DNA-binding MarR family transcriptional regulator
MNDLLRGRGISAAHVIALCALDARPGSSRADLARDMQVTPQAAGGIAEKLVERGLVTRTESGDGRSIELSLTESGRRLTDEVRPALERLRQDVLRLFRPEAAAFIDGAPRHLLNRL